MGHLGVVFGTQSCHGNLELWWPSGSFQIICFKLESNVFEAYGLESRVLYVTEVDLMSCEAGLFCPTMGGPLRHCGGVLVPLCERCPLYKRGSEATRSPHGCATVRPEHNLFFWPLPVFSSALHRECALLPIGSGWFMLI